VTSQQVIALDYMFNRKLTTKPKTTCGTKTEGVDSSFGHRI
jgi:hypothetical protein